METRIDGRDGWVEVTHAGVHVLAKGDAALRERLQTALDGAGEDSLADVVTDELTTGGVRRTPDFAIVDETEGRVLVRGTAAVQVTGPAGTDGEVVAPARGPWADEDLEPGTRAVVLLTGEPEPEPEAAADQQPRATGWAMPSVFGAGAAPDEEAPVVETPAPGGEDVDAEGPAAVPADEAAADGLSESATADGSGEVQDYDFLFGGADQHAGSLLAGHEADGQTPIDSGPVAAAGGYQPPEDPANATLAPPEDEQEAPVSSLPTEPEPAQVEPEATEAAPDEAIDHEPGADLPQFVDGHLVGSRVPAGPAPEGVPEGGASPQQPDEAMVAPLPLEDDAPAPDAEGDTGELPGGPMVLAVRCLSGHHNAPHAIRCRVCGQELPTAQPEPTPRPALGLLRLSTGDVVTLDRGVLIGRAPRAAEETDGDGPHLVRVASPDNEISRNHVEILLDGWHVLVRDLGSTNGTTVALPGSSPVRVRPGDQQTIEPGTTITLADQVSLVFEVTG